MLNQGVQAIGEIFTGKQDLLPRDREWWCDTQAMRCKKEPVDKHAFFYQNINELFIERRIFKLNSDHQPKTPDGPDQRMFQ